MQRYEPEDLIDFPCTYEFKAFGAADRDGQFQKCVQSAIATVVPVSNDSIRTRLSSGGRYQCLTVLVYLECSEQLKEIYAVLRRLDGLKYLL